jgi:hypothetical protein
LADLCYTVNMKIENIAKHLGLVSTLSGALATSLSIDPLNIWLLNAGALLYLFWSVKVRDWNLVAVNAGLLTIYVIGAILRIQ